MDTFLELVVEEMKFSVNQILKDMRNTKRRSACPNPLPAQNVLELSGIRN